MVEMGRVWARKLLTGLRPAPSQKARTPSIEPDRHSMPVADQAQADTALAAACTLPSGADEFASHRRKWPSQPPVNTDEPSGEKATAKISPSWHSAGGAIVSSRSASTLIPPSQERYVQA